MEPCILTNELYLCAIICGAIYISFILGQTYGQSIAKSSSGQGLIESKKWLN